MAPGVLDHNGFPGVFTDSRAGQVAGYGAVGQESRPPRRCSTPHGRFPQKPGLAPPPGRARQARPRPAVKTGRTPWQKGHRQMALPRHASDAGHKRCGVLLIKGRRGPGSWLARTTLSQDATKAVDLHRTHHRENLHGGAWLPGGICPIGSTILRHHSSRVVVASTPPFSRPYVGSPRQSFHSVWTEIGAVDALQPGQPLIARRVPVSAQALTPPVDGHPQPSSRHRSSSERRTLSWRPWRSRNPAGVSCSGKHPPLQLHVIAGVAPSRAASREVAPHEPANDRGRQSGCHKGSHG